MSLIQVEGIYKTYNLKDKHIQKVLSNVNFTVKKGETFVIIGPNGSGKSTLLKILGLIEPTTKGKVLLNQKQINNLSDNEKVKFRRKISFVRQKPVVLNASVFRNVEYGLNIRGIEKSVINSKVEEILEEVGLMDFKNKNARSLSGGEMQRVAIAMSFILDSELYLLDEISANLDLRNIALLERFIRKIQSDPEKTIIISTHDRLEAIKFADRIGILNNGTISQIGTPQEIFTAPQDEFTAQFVGYENIYEGSAQTDDSGLCKIQINDTEIIASELKVGIVKACIRPESIIIAKDPPSKTSFRNILGGKIIDFRDLGIITHVLVESRSTVFLVAITTKSRINLNLELGLEVYISFKATDVKCL